MVAFERSRSTTTVVLLVLLMPLLLSSSTASEAHIQKKWRPPIIYPWMPPIIYPSPIPPPHHGRDLDLPFMNNKHTPPASQQDDQAVVGSLQP
ncbi:uncharacterized protein [Zea mays]|uniref:uncharacterized protein n=1 Tax=Zea mays TaxID=4577 RepID=UPI000221093A|nr:uncharacterized protein LOC111589544 [Zea mays]|eukprot:XP_023156162.1 uncharacterized protein LOC111589544 [Zea mays]